MPQSQNIQKTLREFGWNFGHLTGASFAKRWQTNTTQGQTKERSTLMERTYLSHVPIAVFVRYPLGYVGSTAYPHCPVVGVNPSFAWRGRKAEAERQDAQQAPSPGAVADHLLPLLTRLFSSSSADRQTTKLLFSPSKTFIETQLPGQRHRERRQGECVPYPKASACHMGELQVCVPSALSLISLFFFSPRRRRRKSLGGDVSVRCASLRASLRATVCTQSSSGLICVLRGQLGCRSAQLIGLSCGEMATAPPHK